MRCHARLGHFSSDREGQRNRSTQKERQAGMHRHIPPLLPIKFAGLVSEQHRHAAASTQEMAGNGHHGAS